MIKFVAGCLLACVVPASGAVAAEFGAGLQEIVGVHLPRFDPKTGKRTWLVTAEKAWPEDDNTYLVQRPKVVVYGSEYKIDIASDRGTVTRERRRNVTFVLEGNVTIRIADPGQTVLKTEKLEWKAAEHVLLSDSPVEVQRTDFTVVGVGLELKPEEGGKEVRFIKLRKDVKAEISPAAVRSEMFASITGKADADAEDAEEAPPMFISSDGPMSINRDTNLVSFAENVAARRAEFNIRCDRLDLSFDPRARKVKEIRGSGNVRAYDGENGASGDLLSWDALSCLVEIVGKPAQTWRAAATISAPIIWLNQQDGKVLWTGRAHIYAPPEGSASILRFGGGSE